MHPHSGPSAVTAADGGASRTESYKARIAELKQQIDAQTTSPNERIQALETQLAEKTAQVAELEVSSRASRLRPGCRSPSERAGVPSGGWLACTRRSRPHRQVNC
jgi:hypothetical protein